MVLYPHIFVKLILKFYPEFPFRTEVRDNMLYVFIKISLSHIKPYLLFYLQGGQASRNICHGFDPVPVMAFQKCGYTLKNLICVKAAHHDGR